MSTRGSPQISPQHKRSPQFSVIQPGDSTSRKRKHSPPSGKGENLVAKTPRYEPTSPLDLGRSLEKELNETAGVSCSANDVEDLKPQLQALQVFRKAFQSANRSHVETHCRQFFPNYDEFTEFQGLLQNINLSALENEEIICFLSQTNDWLTLIHTPKRRHNDNSSTISKFDGVLLEHIRKRVLDVLRTMPWFRFVENRYHYPSDIVNSKGDSTITPSPLDAMNPTVLQQQRQCATILYFFEEICKTLIKNSRFILKEVLSVALQAFYYFPPVLPHLENSDPNGTLHHRRLFPCETLIRLMSFTAYCYTAKETLRALVLPFMLDFQNSVMRSAHHSYYSTNTGRSSYSSRPGARGQYALHGDSNQYSGLFFANKEVLTPSLKLLDSHYSERNTEGGQDEDENDFHFYLIAMFLFTAFERRIPSVVGNEWDSNQIFKLFLNNTAPSFSGDSRGNASAEERKGSGRASPTTTPKQSSNRVVAGAASGERLPNNFFDYRKEIFEAVLERIVKLEQLYLEHENLLHSDRASSGSALRGNATLESSSMNSGDSNVNSILDNITEVGSSKSYYSTYTNTSQFSPYNVSNANVNTNPNVHLQSPASGGGKGSFARQMNFPVKNSGSYSNKRITHLDKKINIVIETIQLLNTINFRKSKKKNNKKGTVSVTNPDNKYSSLLHKCCMFLYSKLKEEVVKSVEFERNNNNKNNNNAPFSTSCELWCEVLKLYYISLLIKINEQHLLYASANSNTASKSVSSPLVMPLGSVKTFAAVGSAGVHSGMQSFLIESQTSVYSDFVFSPFLLYLVPTFFMYVDEVTGGMASSEGSDIASSLSNRSDDLLLAIITLVVKGKFFHIEYAKRKNNKNTSGGNAFEQLNILQKIKAAQFIFPLYYLMKDKIKQSDLVQKRLLCWMINSLRSVAGSEGNTTKDNRNGNTSVGGGGGGGNDNILIEIVFAQYCAIRECLTRNGGYKAPETPEDLAVLQPLLLKYNSSRSNKDDSEALLRIENVDFSLMERNGILSPLLLINSPFNAS